jgi:hypothetical protein
MNSVSFSLNPAGALVEVHFGLPAAKVNALRRAGRPIPPPVVAQALIDTGADVSCVDKGILAPLIALGLKPNRFVFANLPAAGGTNLTGEYALGILVPHPSGRPKSALQLRSQPVVEQPLATLGYEALIGRDILARCMLIYDGPSGTFTLGY